MRVRPEEAGDGEAVGRRRERAEAEIVARAEQVDEHDDREPADDGAERGIRHDPLEPSPQRVAGFGEGKADQSECHAGDTGLGDEQRIDRHQRVDPVDAVVDPPGKACPVPDQRGEKARYQRTILDAPDRQHFEREHGPRDRRAEHCAEPGRYTAHQQDAGTVGVEPERAAEAAGEAPAQLDGGAFAPGRTAEQMRHHGAEEDQRCHAQRHPCPRFVDLLDDQVVAAFHRIARQMIEQADHEATERQQVEQPGKREAQPRDGIQAPEECRTQRPDECGHRH